MTMPLDELGTLSIAREELYVEWKVKDFFSQSTKKREFWYSPNFRSSSASWYLQLYPNEGIRSDFVGHVSIYLCRHDHQDLEPCVCCITYTIGIKASDGSVYRSLKCSYSYTNDDFRNGWPRLAEASELLKDKSIIECEGFMTVFCIIHFPERGMMDASQQTFSSNESTGLTTLGKYLKDAFLNGERTDVSIRVKDQEFHAHSLILASWSPVFAAMLGHDMKEKNSQFVDIPDCDPTAFQQLLMYLYTGQITNLTSEHVTDIYMAADKYDVKELKKHCSDFMKQQMSLETFCDVMSIAVRYQDKDLVGYATEFFLENVIAVIETVQWMTFAKDYPVESNELFIKTAKKFISK